MRAARPSVYLCLLLCLLSLFLSVSSSSSYFLVSGEETIVLRAGNQVDILADDAGTDTETETETDSVQMKSDTVSATVFDFTGPGAEKYSAQW